jgi:LysM repeat protein
MIGKPMRTPTIARILAPIIVSLAFGLLAGEEISYVVRKGDTLYAISRRYEVTVSSILRANGLKDGDPLIEGRRIVIPAEKGSSAVQAADATPMPTSFPSPAAERNYVVKPGDTFYGIAKAHSVGLDSLLKANGLSKDSVLKVGRKLVIPGTGSAAAPTPRPSPIPEIIRPSDRAPEAGTESSWPIEGPRSYMTGKLYGIEIRGKEGDAVRAVATGKVLSAGPYRGFGQIVVVTRNDKYIYIYGGQDRLSVKAGDEVRPGTVLGELGVDAKEGKALMYFMAFKNGKAQDPGRCPRD